MNIKNLAIIAGLALFLTASPVLAQRDNTHSQKTEALQRANVAGIHAEVDQDDVVSTASASPSATPKPSCNPEAEWKNHGQFVSCVAKLHMGGATVSAAAKSDVGKKHATVSGEKKSHEGSEEADEKEGSSSAKLQAQIAILEQLIQYLQNLINYLKGLL